MNRGLVVQRICHPSQADSLAGATWAGSSQLAGDASQVTCHVACHVTWHGT
jgi:hypothetical protein